MAGKDTPATRLLRQLGVAHTVHEYRHDAARPDYGAEAVEALGVAAARVFKTLVAEVDGAPTVACVPVTATLDLKALAAAAAGKRARMTDIAAAERATGYVAGGISPLGGRKRLPLVLDTSAADHETIYCSAGRRGLELELSPGDLAATTGAVMAPIAG